MELLKSAQANKGVNNFVFVSSRLDLCLMAICSERRQKLGSHAGDVSVEFNDLFRGGLDKKEKKKKPQRNKLCSECAVSTLTQMNQTPVFF